MEVCQITRWPGFWTPITPETGLLFHADAQDESGETLSSVSQALGVAATQLKTWRLEQQAAGSAEAVARRKAEATELQHLRRENKRLQEANEILRKASAFFAKWAEKA